MTAINQITTPAGTTGLVCEPWTPGEIYGVAANWAQASAPIFVYGRNGWDTHPAGLQVADYRHRKTAALEAVITDAIAVSEGIPSDEVDSDEVDAIVADAVEVRDSSDSDE